MVPRTEQERRLMEAAARRDREHPPPPMAAPARVVYPKMVRAPRVGKLFALVASTAGVGCWLHWSEQRARSYPCVGVNCGCDASASRRWYGWLSARTHLGGDRSIVELTGPAAEVLSGHLDGTLGLAGLSLSLERDPRSRGHGLIVLVHGRRPLADLPPALDLMPELLRLWGLDAPGEERVPCWDWPFDLVPEVPAVPFRPRIVAGCPACGAAGLLLEGEGAAVETWECPSCEQRWLRQNGKGAVHGA